MAVTGIGLAFCKPTGTDKKPSIGLRQLHLLSPAAMVHQSKKVGFPFVPLTGHKGEVDPGIPPDFNINEQRCETDFSFVKGNNFVNARSIFKNESGKGCHQFPMISISSLVGGFVGSKSQTPSENRESHQVWDVVFRKLDEFVHSKAAETYANHCYQFQALSQNFIGSLCQERSSSFGLSYILADTCQSFQNCKGPSTSASSSPPSKTVTETIPLLETFVPQNTASPSPTPSVQPTSVPVLLNIVEHLISQPNPPTDSGSSPTDLSESESSLVDLPSASAPPNVVLDPSTTLPGETKQTYAEVAKMANSNFKIEQDRHRATKNPTKCSRKTKYRHFGKNFASNDSCQRGMNTYHRSASPGVKEQRREHFRPNLLSSDANRGLRRRVEQKSDTTNYRHHNRNFQGLKYFKNIPESYKGGNLGTVPETNARTETENRDTCSFDAAKVRDSPCPYYNHKKNSCINWRCRQHVQKPSVKRDMKCILMDNIVGVDYDRTYNSDLSPTTPDANDRVNTLGSYFERPLSLSKLTRARFGCNLKDSAITEPVRDVLTSRPCEESPPVIATRTCDTVQDQTRIRSSSETGACPTKPFVKERSASESSESIKNVQRCRSISEDSKTNSLSSSSVGSLSSVKSSSEPCARRRFSSECDSEDSFVIFDGGADDDSDTSDSDSEYSGSSDESRLSDSDEVDAACLKVAAIFCLPVDITNICKPCHPPALPDVDASQKTKQLKPRKKVRFAPDESLETVHLMVAWDFAYRAARCGPWEEMARDRERFKLRVARTEAVLAPVLSAAHRAKVLRRRECTPMSDSAHKR